MPRGEGGGRPIPPTLTPNIRHWTQLPKNSHLEWAMNSLTIKLP